ncbi:hypothetical protein LZ31DRAFT_86813 [Colletotrichum somersetense]|nr:hypothetical protein LZ31DRAFT_86813 [Colletotrichum somersetense]
MEHVESPHSATDYHQSPRSIIQIKLASNHPSVPSKLPANLVATRPAPRLHPTRKPNPPSQRPKLNPSSVFSLDASAPLPTFFTSSPLVRQPVGPISHHHHNQNLRYHHRLSFFTCSYCICTWNINRGEKERQTREGRGKKRRRKKGTKTPAWSSWRPTDSCDVDWTRRNIDPIISPLRSLPVTFCSSTSKPPTARPTHTNHIITTRAPSPTLTSTPKPTLAST